MKSAFDFLATALRASLTRGLAAFALTVSGLSACAPKKPMLVDPQQIAPQITLTDPSTESSSSITFEFPEVNLAPGQAIALLLPEKLKGRNLDFVEIAHRQDANINKKRSAHDSRPGRTSLFVFGEFERGMSDWRIWRGLDATPSGSKFAEPRPNRKRAEVDQWYDWKVVGNCSVNGKNCLNGDLKPSHLLFVSTGLEDVLISKFVVGFTPPAVSHWHTTVLADGITAGDPIVERGRFEGQISRGRPLEFISETARSSDEMTIPVKVDGRVRSIECYLGDGKFGNARVSITLERKGKASVSIIDDENVPPVGVLYGYPTRDDIDFKRGDYFKVRATNGKFWLGAIRIGYD